MKRAAKKKPKDEEVTAAVHKAYTDMQLQADTFTVIHARIALNDGVSPSFDATAAREKLFEIISTAGWEGTLVVLASCARLFAQVSSPVPDLRKVTKEFLYQLAHDLEARRQPMRHVDQDAVRRTRI